MKYVIDSSVAMKWVLQESGTPAAEQLRNEFRQRIHELISPDVFAIEVAHGLTKAQRRNLISDSAKLIAEILSTPPKFYPSLALLPRAVELANQARIAVYDCLYVALAEQESCELITADMRLIHSLNLPFVKPL